MADNNIREYLIALGFDVDKKSQADMVAAVREGALQADILFGALEGMVEQFGRTVGAFADRLQGLYFDARIFKATAQELYVFTQAAEKVHRTTEQATQDFKNFAGAMINDPLAKGIAESFAGINDAQFSKLTQTQKFVDFIQGLSHQSEMVQRIFAEKLHIPYETLKLYEQPEFFSGLQQSADQLKRMGADVNASALAGHTLDETFIELKHTLDDFSKSTAVTQFLIDVNGKLKELNSFLKEHAKDISDFAKEWLHFGEALVVGVGGVGVIGAVVKLTQALKSLFALAPPPWLVALTAAYQALEVAKHPGDLSYYLNPFASNNARARELWNRDHPGEPYPGSAGAAGTPAPAATPPDNRNAIQKAWDWTKSKLGLGPAPSGTAAPGPQEAATAGKWWTPDRQAHAVQRLMKEAGLSEQGARALVARWATVESPHGPASVNPYSGAFGIEQDLGARKAGIAGDTNFDDQLTHAVNQLNSTESRAARMLRSNDPWTAAAGASQYERAEGYNPATGTDNFTNRVYGAMKNIAIMSPAAAAEALKRFPVGGSAGSLSPFFDTGALGAFSPQPSGVTDNSKHSALDQKTTIQLFGVGEGNVDLGAKIARYQSGVNADAIRNLSNSSVA